MGWAAFGDRWLSRASGLWTFASPVVPGTLAAVVIALASKSVAWINAFGVFGVLTSGLISFVLATIAFALIARTRLWRLESKRQERMQGNSSIFDPMARVYENKRLYLRDLAPVGRRTVSKKKFINCEIIGPGTAVIGLSSDTTKPSSQLRDCNTFDVDCIEIAHGVKSHLAIDFWDCDFDGCNFYHMTLLFLARHNDTLNWITPDFRQIKMLEGQSDD